MPKYAATSNTMTAKPPLINERMAQPHGREGLENGCGDGGIGIMKDLESHFEIQAQTTWKNSVGAIHGVWAEYLKNKNIDSLTTVDTFFPLRVECVVRY